MATDYDLRLVVDADTDEAQRKLDALGGGGSQPSSVPQPSAEAQAAAASVRQTVASIGGGGAGADPQAFGTAAGQTAGRIIAAAVTSALPRTAATPAPSATPQAPRAPAPVTPAPSAKPTAPISPAPEPAQRPQPGPRPQPAPVQQPTHTPAPRPQPAPVSVPSSQPPRAPSPATPSQNSGYRVYTPEEWAAEQKKAKQAYRDRGEPPKPNNVQTPEDFGKKAGDVAGRMIGKAVAGFVAHEVAGTMFSSLKTPGGDNRTVNKAEASVGGALRYGTMGAMLGGPLGAVIGGVVGLGMGYLGEQTRQKKEIEADENATRISDFARKRDTAVSASDSAFSRSLELSGGWRQRLEALRARREEIANGSGQTSIKSLENFIKGADPNSRNAIELKGILETQKNRVASLDQQILQEGLAIAPSRLDAGDVGDSWSKRGIGIGATVDVSQVNEKIMGEVQSCRVLLEKIANMGTDNIQDIQGMQKAVFE